jgi:hypothetical protein
LDEKPRIDVHWYSEEKRIIHVVFHAKWDWKDFHDQRESAYTLIRQNSHDIAILMEWEKDAAMSPTNTLNKLSKSVETASDKIGMVVLVTPSPLWQVILQTLKKLMPNSILQRTYFVKNHEEALLLLEPYLNDAKFHK